MLPARVRKLSYSIAFVILLYFLFNSLTFSLSSHLPTSVIGSNASSPLLNQGGSLEEKSDSYRFLPERLSKVFPPLDPSSRQYHEWNDQTLRELHVCMALHNCGPNQFKVALLASHWFEEAVVRGWRGGEGVWCGVKIYI